jgi:hypothetical protein
MIQDGNRFEQVKIPFWPKKTTRPIILPSTAQPSAHMHRGDHKNDYTLQCSITF